MSSQSFDKSSSSFPIKEFGVPLQSCGVNGMCAAAYSAGDSFSRLHRDHGAAVFRDLPGIVSGFHQTLAALMRTAPEHISCVRNAAEGLSMIANGYPFEPGDEIISYAHEYPSNHYPWKIQERRGAVLKLLPDADPSGSIPAGRPRGFDLADLERLITPRTRVVALSHVQYHSGFAADVDALAALCRAHKIDLVLDVAQSLGGLPVYPERWGAAAVVGSGWKWLFGPVGVGVMYTSGELRAKVDATLTGPDMMRQQTDYLNLSYAPLGNGEYFEYSTVSYSLAAGLEAAARSLLAYEPEAVRQEIFRLQDVFLAAVDRDLLRPVLHRPENRSGILSLIPVEADPAAIMDRAKARGVLVSTRGGYLRVAPHFYVSDEEMTKAAAVLNEVARE